MQNQRYGGALTKTIQDIPDYRELPRCVGSGYAILRRTLTILSCQDSVRTSNSRKCDGLWGFLPSILSRRHRDGSRGDPGDNVLCNVLFLSLFLVLVFGGG